MSPAPPPKADGRKEFERVSLTHDAIADLHGISDRSAAVPSQIFTALKRLDAGPLRPIPLQDYGTTGDRTDCGKIVVETDGCPAHRIVARDLGNGVEISEVVAVEERTEDLAYLLAGVSVRRIADPLRRSDTQSTIARIRRLRDQPETDC